MTDKPESPVPDTQPAPPTTQAPVKGCPLCDTWSQWVGARVQEQGGFADKPITPAELHDLLMVGFAVGDLVAADDYIRLCPTHLSMTEGIANALEPHIAELGDEAERIAKSATS